MPLHTASVDIDIPQLWLGTGCLNPAVHALGCLRGEFDNIETSYNLDAPAIIPSGSVSREFLNGLPSLTISTRY